MLMESATRCHRVTLLKRDLEPELELEPEQKRDLEPEPELELEPEQKRLKSEQEPKRLKSEQEPKLTSETNESDSDESDSDESDDDYLEDYKRRQQADEVYREKSRGLSRYDAIPRPRRSLLCSSSFVAPLFITEHDLPVLEKLSKIALDHYKKGSGASFEFHRIVKCTFNFNIRPYVRQIINYYITFEAKAKGDPSDSPGAIKIFQAKVVVDQLDKDKQPFVEEC